MRVKKNKTTALRAPGKKKKNTKRWCKGVKGRKHEGTWQDYDAVKHVGLPRRDWRWRILVCAVCKKHLQNDFPRAFHAAP